MAVTQRQVFEASDGTRFDTEQEARDHELALELGPMIEGFLDRQDLPVRVRRQQVANLMRDFALQLLAPPAPETEPTDE